MANSYFCRSYRRKTGRRTFSPPHLWHKCFPVNFEKFVRTPFLQNTSGRLLLKMDFSLIINLLIMELHVSSIMTLYSVPEA